jgi:hypothetical protein
LQFNEQKYYYYEKVLRDLILNKATPDEVKIQLKEKIESQELFVPKEDRKVRNIIIENRELQEKLALIKQENKSMR